MGINKDEARKRWGPDQVHLWQRSYDIAPPGGESLRDTALRVVPFYDKWITPELQKGKSVIVVAHGNSLRSLIMQLDQLSPEEVMEVELGTGMPLVYKLNADGTVAEKHAPRRLTADIAPVALAPQQQSSLRASGTIHSLLDYPMRRRHCLRRLAMTHYSGRRRALIVEDEFLIAHDLEASMHASGLRRLRRSA